MVDLLPEIWLKFPLYAPDDVVSKLYSINRVSFDHTMNMKYRDLVVKFPLRNKPNDKKLLTVRIPVGITVGLRNETNRRRVRSLHLSDSPFYYGHQGELRDIKRHTLALSNRTAREVTW